jgi:RNA-directed DNA polymerase
MQTIVVTRGLSISTMAMSTLTTRLIQTMFVACAEDNDQSGVFSFRSLYDAYLNCRRHKRNANNTLKFEADLLGNLTNLQQQLISGCYRPSRSVCFYTTKPKLREIIAADFRDRVVHHCLVSHLEKVFEPKFIYDSYGCRVNKGTHAAVRRLQQFIHKTSSNNQGHSSIPSYQSAWYLQLDIRSFFTSIDHNILLGLLAKQRHDPQLMSLAEVIIRHKSTDNCVVRDKKT